MPRGGGCLDAPGNFARRIFCLAGRGPHQPETGASSPSRDSRTSERDAGLQPDEDDIDSTTLGHGPATSAAASRSSAVGSSGVVRTPFSGALDSPYDDDVVPRPSFDERRLRRMPADADTYALFQLLWSKRAALTQVPLDAQLVEHVLSLMDTVQAGSLGVSVADVARLLRGCGIGYQEVYSGPDMTICVFVLRAGARIPLHDHPGMHVFGRLLFGRMNVVSFDVAGLAEYDVQQAESYRGENEAWKRWPPLGSRWASNRTDQVFGPAPTTYALDPVHRNVHEISALEDCAFFDIVVPPYDARAGRDCTYYTARGVVSTATANGGEDGVDSTANRHLLLPVRPLGFSTEPMQYMGPVFPPCP